jgi:hypothetical protein
MGLIGRLFGARCALWALGVALVAGGTGCNVIGAAAQVLARPGDTDAAYKGLANQTVAVMVWVDRGPALDYPMLQSDIAKSMTINLHDISHPKDKKDEKDTPETLKGTEYRDPMSVLRFQQAHPEFEGMPIEDVASRLGVTRVIYVEVYNFQTRSNLSVELFRGTIQTKVEVLEVSVGPDGKKTAHAAYTEPDLRVNFPEKDVEAAKATAMSEQQIYQATVKAFVEGVGVRFYKHESDQ